MLTPLHYATDDHKGRLCRAPGHEWATRAASLVRCPTCAAVLALELLTRFGATDPMAMEQARRARAAFPAIEL